MVAILRIEYFNKNEEQFAIDVSGYKSYKHFIKAYRSFVNRCNNDGYGTSLLYVGGYFKLHECEETQVVISNKNISKISFELLDDSEFRDILEERYVDCLTPCCEECECEEYDEYDTLEDIDDKLYFIEEKLDEVLDKLNKKEKKEDKKDEDKPKTTGKKKVLLENK